MLPKIQIAPDTLDPNHALELALIFTPYENIIEASTPLIKSTDIGIYSRLKAAHSDKTTLGDVSIYRNVIGCRIRSQPDIAQDAKIIAQRIHES